jgi:hypothetical protein
MYLITIEYSTKPLDFKAQDFVSSAEHLDGRLCKDFAVGCSVESDKTRQLIGIGAEIRESADGRAERVTGDFEY